MSDRIRFHLDEHVHPAIADGLKRRGIDVTTTVQAGLVSASDDEQLAFTRVNHRVLVTHDADFLRLQEQGVPHAGIAYCRQGSRSIGELLRSLVVLWEHVTAAELSGHVEFL